MKYQIQLTASERKALQQFVVSEKKQARGNETIFLVLPNPLHFRP